MDHERRMTLARSVTDYVLHRHSDVIAVAVHGSTATSEDREHSDLEMFAITRGQSETRGFRVIHEGIAVEIELISEDRATREPHPGFVVHGPGMRPKLNLPCTILAW